MSAQIRSEEASALGDDFRSEIRGLRWESAALRSQAERDFATKDDLLALSPRLNEVMVGHVRFA